MASRKPSMQRYFSQDNDVMNHKRIISQNKVSNCVVIFYCTGCLYSRKSPTSIFPSYSYSYLKDFKDSNLTLVFLKIYFIKTLDVVLPSSLVLQVKAWLLFLDCSCNDLLVCQQQIQKHQI